MTRYPFSSYPSGWYFVAYTSDLAAGSVLPLRYFGEDLVLYRTDAGEPVLLSAHCPHLGAHLGHGGKVQGNCLRCPFHAWELDQGGQCTKVPYASRIPPRAHVRAWPLCERNGVVLAYYDAHGRPPSFEIPEIPGYLSERYTAPVRVQFRVRTHVQEFRENTVDIPHFVFVHRADHAEATAEIDGHILRGRARAEFDLGYLGKPGTKAEMILDFAGYGLGYLVADEHIAQQIHFVQLAMSTPIDEEYVDVRFNTAVEIGKSRQLAERAVGMSAADSKMQLERDIPIWENKLYRDRPTLCDGDGPIMAFRRYARQFYPEAATALVPDRQADIRCPAVKAPSQEIST
jgi:phenylpropionate dioxygenase-like ring-hydroxylating dioxygenase large terminal subunit